MKRSTPTPSIHDFALEHGIDIEADMGRNSHLLPQLAVHNERMTDGGADYLFSQLDYLDDSKKVTASRFIAAILAGKRTELAYWALSAPTKQLKVHRGLGSLVVAEDGLTTDYVLNPRITGQVTLPPGVIYTFEAAERSRDPLVVSGLYPVPTPSWDDLEKVIQPGQATIETIDGDIAIPEDFSLRFAHN